MLIELLNEYYDKFEENRINNSFNKSLNSLKVNSKLNTELLFKDLRNLKKLFRPINNSSIEWRIKSEGSLKLKINKYINKYGSFSLKSVANDLVGYRIKVADSKQDVLSKLSQDKRFRVVNLLECDNGYRAIHLYTSIDNFKYPYEVQLWFQEDYDYNFWMHKLTYKQYNDEFMNKLYKMRLNGEINSELDMKLKINELNENSNKDLEWGL